MGLFDGAADGQGSTADLASLFDLPVVLVVDVRGMGASAAALIEGFTHHRDDVEIAGILLNRVASPEHAALLRRACDDRSLSRCSPACRAISASSCRRATWAWCRRPKCPSSRPSSTRPPRSSGARPTWSGWSASPGRSGSASTARPPDRCGRSASGSRSRAIPPSPSPIPATLEGWRAAGAEILPFAPLADQPPDAGADAVYLPGGYPELHAGRLAANRRFLDGLRAAAARSAFVYGECGGYMALGRTLTDRAGARHPMAGLLPVATSFAEPRRQLGYRRLKLLEASPLGQAGTTYRGHEFHYASLIGAGDAPPFSRSPTPAAGRSASLAPARARSRARSCI